MKLIVNLIFSVMLFAALFSCEKLKLKKDKDYREPYYGYYGTHSKCERFTNLPDPPAGVISDQTIEIKVDKSDADSSILVNGEVFKMDNAMSYYKEDDFGTSQPYNYTLLKFYTTEDKDSIYMQRSNGSQSLFEVCIWRGGRNRGL